MPQEMGEFDWDGKKEEQHRREIRRVEIVGVVMFFVIVGGVVSLFIPFGDLFLTDEELAERYEFTHEWVNRCDEECRQHVNMRFVNALTDCEGLSKQYQMNRNNYLLDWRLAIDDRGASLGCEGFPKDMRTIVADTEATLQAEQQQLEVARIKEEEKERDREQSQWPLYRQSLRDGDVQKYVTKFQQDESDPSTMVIVVSNVWLIQNELLRKQIAEVMWQKWVNVRDPFAPESVRIRLLHPEGGVIGGSPPEAARPIWIKTDVEMQTHVSSGGVAL